MSEMDILRQEMAGDILAIYGQDATYHFQNGGGSQSITVRLRRDVETYDKAGDIVYLQLIVGISATDIPSPKMNDTLEIDGETHTIGQEIKEGAGLRYFELI